MVIYDFIGEINNIDFKVLNCCNKCCLIKYLSCFNEFENTEEYKEKLENYLKKFRYEIQVLPFKLPTKQARKVFLNNIYDELQLSSENLNFHIKGAITLNYNCIFEKNSNYGKYLPRFILRKCVLKARQAYSILNDIYNFRRSLIERAIEIIEMSAYNDGFILKTVETDEERIKTNLSSPELSYFLNLICETISIEDGYTKSNLSKVIAKNFSTKHTLQPKASQIRKHFTEANDNVINNVKDLVSELFDKIHNN